jgi:hypothetical protein
LNDPNAGVILIMRKTHPWVLLLSVVGFINGGILVLLAVASWAGIESGRAGTPPGPALLLYPLMGLLWFVPSFYLYKYARRIHTFVAQGHQVQLESALEAQRTFWKFLGIVALVVIVLTAVAVALAIAIGVMASL